MPIIYNPPSTEPIAVVGAKATYDLSDPDNLQTSIVTQFTSVANSGVQISDASQTGLNFGSGDFTLSAWVKYMDDVGEAWFVGKGNTSGFDAGYSIFRRGGIGSALVLRVSNGTISYEVVFNGTLNTWTHLTLRRTAGAVEGFLNGVKSASTVVIAGSSDSTDPFTIGNSGGPMAGGNHSVAHVIAWSRAVPDAEIAALSIGGIPIAPYVVAANHATDAVSYYPLNEPHAPRFDRFGSNDLVDVNAPGVEIGPNYYRADYHAGINRWVNKSDVSPGSFGDAECLSLPLCPTVNSQGIPEWSGSDAGLVSATGAIVQPATIVVVHAYASSAVTTYLIDGANSSDRMVVFKNSSQNRYFGGSTRGGPAADQQRHVQVAIFDGAGSSLMIDGVQVDTGNVGSNSLTGLSIGDRYDGADPMVGTIEAVLVFAEVLKPAAIAVINTLYGLAPPGGNTLTPPTDLVLDPSPTSILVTWVDSVDPETNYQLQISSDAGATWDSATFTAADVLTYLIETLTPGTPYSVRIRSLDNTGVSDWLEDSTSTQSTAIVSADQIAWLKTENFIPGTGVWTDNSPILEDFDQPSGGNGVVIPSWRNGEAAVSFVDRKLLRGPTAGFADTFLTEGTIFFVGRLVGSAFRRVFQGMPSSGTPYLCIRADNASNVILERQSTTSSLSVVASIAPDTDVIIGMRLSAGNVFHLNTNGIIYDGTLNPFGAEVGMDRWFLSGRDTDTASNYIAEFIIYETALTDPAFNSIMVELGAKYNLPVV